MQGIGFLAAIIVGGLAGWAASSIMKANTGLLMNVVLGIVGALVANLIFGLIGVNFDPTWLGQGIAGLVGASILILIARAIRR
ncbi:GlsB/YeaQ/YmgE family stress response membrane protein [Rhodobacterales bacterium HKCCE2091]|nr:GlsB/YeaQ/YmgE family stress response membrane protein [Rhodobacterales bacterium HKCCE2091]